MDLGLVGPLTVLILPSGAFYLGRGQWAMGSISGRTWRQIVRVARIVARVASWILTFALCVKRSRD